MRVKMSRLCGCFLTLFLAGCATNPQEPAVPRPDAVHPKVVKLSFTNGLAAVSYYYGADGVTAWLESHEPQDPHNATTPQVVKRTTQTPSSRQWNRFWRTLDRMQIERWKPTYLPTDDPNGVVMTDGTDWTLTVNTTSLAFRSGGYEAFPAVGRPERTMPLLMGADLERHSKSLRPREQMVAQLEQAFDQLLQEPPEH